MSVYLEMPKLSDTMTEGTVVKWHKAVGDPVEIGDVVAEIETDKAVMELEAFDEGTLTEIYIGEGNKAPIGEKLALLVEPGGSAPATPGAAPIKESPQPNIPAPKPAAVPSQETVANLTVPSNGRVKASPLAKKIAADKAINLHRIQGTGPGGRIVAKDVESASLLGPTPASLPVPAAAAAEGDRRIPLTGMRKIIAERLLASKTQIPHFYLNLEVDAGKLLRLRAQLNQHLEKTGSGKLTINDFLLRASVLAATKVPRVNASFSGDAVVEHADIHLAVAVAIEDGLVTPVIRQAQKKSLREISAAVKDLASRARSKKLKPDEYQGGTITVSNLGSYGIESFSAVINPPQAVILAMGAIVKKPAVSEKDELVVSHRMAIGLSADHRVVDGSIGAQYLAELRNLIEHPVLILI